MKNLIHPYIPPACSSDNPNRFHYLSRCYEVFNVDYATRFDAVQASELCRVTRGALADIRGQAHQELLIAEAKKTVRRNYNRHGFWLGMKVDDSVRDKDQ